MAEIQLRPSQRAWWQRFLVYTLFIASTFTIAASEASIILLMALALWQLAREGTAPWQSIPRWFVAAYLALPAVVLISALANPDPLTTLDHFRRHYRIFLPFALLPALAFVNLRKVLVTYGVFVILIGIYGAIQYRYGVDWFRPEGQKLITPYRDGVFNGKGNFTHHLTYAGFMLINVPLFAALAASGERPRRWFWAVTALLAAVGTVVSLGRSGWLGMCVALLVLAAIRLPRRWGMSLLVAGAVGIAATAVLLTDGWLKERFLQPSTPLIVQRLIRTGLSHDVDRLRLWESGWLAFQAKPVLGHGWGNQDPALEPYRQQVAAKYGGYKFLVSAGAGLHNIYLQMAFAVGVTGLVAYLVFWGGVFTWCARALTRAGPGQPFERALLLGTIAGIAGSMTAGWFENNFLDGEVQTLLMMLVGIALFAGIRLLQPGFASDTRPA